ncbi:hypothetical protein PENSPDRAFT_81286 [Peniophora sp. CONT]|nr:hypothetical protein PENSPDRAFT_81286 [Peniophora sp. CONT]
MSLNAHMFLSHRLRWACHFPSLGVRLLTPKVHSLGGTRTGSIQLFRLFPSPTSTLCACSLSFAKRIFYTSPSRASHQAGLPATHRRASGLLHPCGASANRGRPASSMRKVIFDGSTFPWTRLLRPMPARHLTAAWTRPGTAKPGHTVFDGAVASLASRIGCDLPRIVGSDGSWLLIVACVRSVAGISKDPCMRLFLVGPAVATVLSLSIAFPWI